MKKGRPDKTLRIQVPARRAFGALLTAALFAGPVVLFPGAQERASGAQDAAGTVRVETQVVGVLAVVRDLKGKLITDLNREDFEIREDGVQQEVRYFSRETDTALTIGLLIDTSGSVRNVLETEKDQAKLFLSRVLRPGDLAFVINFDLEVTLIQDFTNDMRDLSEAIDSVVINTGGTLPVWGPGSYPGRRRFPLQGPYPIPGPGPFPGPSTRPPRIPPTFPGRSPAGTLLYDAVYLSATEQLTDEAGRKVLILLSDGRDQGSRTELSSAISSVLRADTVIYSLSISDRSAWRSRGVSALRRLSRNTGGRVIKVGKPKDMGVAFEQIAEELRSQYSLGYTPSSKKDGVGFRKIEVRVRGGKYKVQARRGYYPRPRE